MRFRISIIVILLLSLLKGKAQYSVDTIINKSKAFYSGINSGIIKVSSLFKSAIAESHHISEFDILFCKKEKITKIEFDSTEKILTGDTYYQIFKYEKKYINYQVKYFISDLKEDLKQYPYFNPIIFDSIKKKEFKAELSGKTFHLFNSLEHFYFDTLTFCLLRYANLNFSEYGLQIKEWKILNQQYYNDRCPERINDMTFLKNYKKETKTTIVKKNNYKGKTFRQSIPGQWLYFSTGDSISVDALQGHYILVDFFYQSCMPCIASFQHLKDLYNAYSVNGKLLIIGIDPIPDDSTSMERFKKRYGLNYPVITGINGNKLNRIFNTGGIYPCYLLINPEGKIVYIGEGYNENFFKKVNEELSKNN